MTDSRVAKRLKVNGIVQGVGFRPFVFQLAGTYNLKGEVANTSSGVLIHIEGAPDNIAAFETELSENSPPLAYIVEITSQPESIQNFIEFSIVKSKGQAKRSTLISPDVAVCNDCLGEMQAPDDRRYHYPFINCTNCGPRYTIIDDIPYDRPKTSMRHFKMCSRCQAEYDEPTDRRFHAQPNACGDCGPHVDLHDSQRRLISSFEHAIKNAAQLLKQGRILAVKGLGGYHLAVDATNSKAVKQLRQRKMREEKPFAVMSLDLETVRRYARFDSDEEKLLTSIQRPIVLLKKRSPNVIAGEVAPGNKNFGVMLPYTPLHYLLLEYGFDALVMTSGNLSEEPIAIDNDDAFERLGRIADYFLIHNRDIYLRSDDSIVRKTAGDRRFLRRSRGYVPIPVFLKNKVSPILACGAELKNTICVTKEDKAFLSQHIGDLENLQTYEFLTLTVNHLKRILDIEPEIIAHDMHPDYMSTRYAADQQVAHRVQVQHHHAHIVSCMAEHKLEGEVIGLSFDGTGYGTDGAIWGGELLIVREDDFERSGHLAYVPMPGGAAAIKEPWRMAVSYLQEAYGANLNHLELPLVRAIDSEKLTVIGEMIGKGINSPPTSSLGRLFDAVAAICGIRDRVNFEGQAAMELEMAAIEDTVGVYEYGWDRDGIYRISTAPIIQGVVKDVSANRPVGEISSRFHRTLISLFADLSARIGKEQKIKRVVLSGGVFQNTILLTGLSRALEEKGFQVFSHQQVPTNDGGVSLGQAVVAAAKLKR